MCSLGTTMFAHAATPGGEKGITHMFLDEEEEHMTRLPAKQ